MNQGDNHINEAAVPGRPNTLHERVQGLRLPAHMGRGRGGSGRLPWVLCLILLLTTIAFGAKAFRSPGSDKPVLPEQTTRATAESGDTVLEAKGYVIPAHQIQVSPKVAGMVLDLLFEEGKQVEKGAILARLETTDYQADRDRAQAAWEAAEQRALVLKSHRPEEIAQAKDELDEAEANLKQLRLEFERLKKLGTSQGVSQSELERAEFGFRAMEKRAAKLTNAHKLMKDGPRLEMRLAAEADMRLAKAELEKAEWRLDNCVVRAPVSGTILTKKAEKGNIVNPMAFNVSASLCDMADLSDLEVELTIQERDIKQVQVGQKCRVTPEAFQERKYDGEVSRIMPIADRAKGAIPVRVKLQVPREEEGKYLKPDMGVIVSFLKVEKKD